MHNLFATGVHLNSFYQHSNIFAMTSHQDIKLHPLYISNQRLRKKTPFLHRISWIWLQSPLPESYGAWCICAYWKIFGYKVVYIFTYLGVKKTNKVLVYKILLSYLTCSQIWLNLVWMIAILAIPEIWQKIFFGFFLLVSCALHVCVCFGVVLFRGLLRRNVLISAGSASVECRARWPRASCCYSFLLLLLLFTIPKNFFCPRLLFLFFFFFFFFQ